MNSMQSVLLAQRHIYKKKLQKIIPRNPRTIEVFLTVMTFFLDKERYTMTELKQRFEEVDGKPITLPGFKRHIDLLLKHSLLSRPHYRGYEFNTKGSHLL